MPRSNSLQALEEQTRPASTCLEARPPWKRHWPWKHSQAKSAEKGSPTSTSPASMEVDGNGQAPPLDVDKLRTALAAIGEAFGKDSPQAGALQVQLDKAVEARRASVPTHVQLQRVERKITAVEAMLEASHSAMDEIDKELAKLEKLKIEVLDQGKQAQAFLDQLLVDKAAILQKGQSRGGQFIPEQAHSNMLGLAEEQIRANPALCDMLQQLQELVSRIKAQEEQSSGAANVEDRHPVCSPTQLQGEGTLADSQVLGPPHEGAGKGASRQRSSPYPSGPLQTKAELETQPAYSASSARDLGLEEGGEDGDSLADRQDLP